MYKALRQAQIYGYLISRTDRLYHPGGRSPVCSLSTARAMVHAGWLADKGGKYEITPRGRDVFDEDVPRNPVREIRLRDNMR